jgi:hypothetical protein
MKIYINGKRQVPKKETLVKKATNSRTRKGRFAISARGARICVAILIALALLVIKGYCDRKEFKYVSPVPEGYIYEPKPVYAAVPDQGSEDPWPDDYSFLVETYAQKYAKTKQQKLYLTYQLHCLLRKESFYYENKGHGDGGLAGGVLQYHQATWNAFRNEMIRKGLVKEVGSRYDVEQAIETTAYALANGKENHWGPVARGECR